MKVILFNSPIYNRKVGDIEDYLPPFGLGYIATILQKENIDVKIIDCVNDNLTVEEIISIIGVEEPNFVGINIFSVNFDLVKEIIEKCPYKTNFLVGGKSTKFLYQDIINFKTNNSISVIIGEGEYIICDIVKNQVSERTKLQSNNRFVYEVDKDSIYLPQDISKLPLNRTLFGNRSITNVYGKIEEAIITSRECLYNCAFCGGARSLNSNVPVRERDEESITEELTQISCLHPETKSIRVLDDLFLKNRNSILKAIKIFGKFNFEWRAMGHIKSLQGSEDLFVSLKDSGCRELEIGIESGNDEIRKMVHKVGSVEEVYDVITRLLDAGINVKGYFMYGLPDETEKECQDTYNLALKIYEYSQNSCGLFRTSAFQFRPYHGTELYNKINKHISFKHNDALDELDGRKQFNFTAGNFSKCSDDAINNFVIKTNKLGENNEFKNRKVPEL